MWNSFIVRTADFCTRHAWAAAIVALALAVAAGSGAYVDAGHHHRDADGALDAFVKVAPTMMLASASTSSRMRVAASSTS
jgi:hypothetical protein